MASRPILTEPGVKYFLGETLKNCKKNKDVFNVQLFNLALFIGFLTIVTALLVYKYKTKPGPEEMKKKHVLKEIILSIKLENYKQIKLACIIKA